MERIIVGGNSVLGRFGLFPPIPFHHNTANSIELMTQTILLVQQGHPRAARDCLRCQALRDEPNSIITWVDARLHGCRHANAHLEVHRVHVASMVYLLEIKGNPFHERFVELATEFRNVQPPEGNPSPITFVAVGEDKYWSCGLNKRSIQGYPEGKPWKGDNIYGRLLDTVFGQFCKNSLDGGPIYTVQQLLSHQRPLTSSSYNKTVLILSDSQSRYLESVQGGVVVAIGGATYDRLAREVDRRGLSFKDFRVVIIICGVNVSPGAPYQWQNSWRPLNEKLSVLQQCPETSVIINGVINVPTAKNVKQHSIWMQNQLDRQYSPQQFHYCDWSKFDESNMFLRSPGVVNRSLFARDEFHVNPAGYRCLWAKFQDTVPDLKMLKIKVSDTPYPGRLRE